ncbi:MAG: T9SS type A sorting domain-containing protein [Saprospiraceae bacterium]|jgi:hypothetical protein
MLRAAFIFALVTGLVGLSAFRAEKPKFGERPFSVNTTESHFFHSNDRSVPVGIFSEAVVEADTSAQLHVLMMNYTAYDSAYANKVHRIIQQRLPSCVVSDFWDGSPEELQQALTGNEVVVIAYPSGGNAEVLKAYSKILTQYVKNGGGIILTGTHEFSILQQLGLFDLDFGYFCAEPMIHSVVLDHPVLAGFSGEKALKNYAYPLDVSDPGFVTIADVRGYPVMGYKCLAAGKVAYLGLEYYYDEIESSHFLANTIRWIAQPKRSVGVSTSTSSGDNNWVSKSPKRSEELLRAGTGLTDPVFDVKIYPNPYVTKATIDLDLAKASAVAIDVTDETGRIVGILLPLKNLNAGLYRLEMPNLSPGVYFVQFKSGEKTVVKKVVKTVGN